MEYDRQGFATAPDGTRLFFGVRGPRPEPTGDSTSSGVDGRLDPRRDGAKPEGGTMVVPRTDPDVSAARSLPAPDAHPAFVLTDGIGCDGFAWKYLQPHLAERHRVLHWHYRAHGRSSLPSDVARIDTPAHARDLLAVMDAAGIERAILAGHSMGTQVSLEAYRLAPDRILGMVLMCGSYGKITTTFHGSDVLKQVLPSIIQVVEKNQDLARALWGRIPPGLAFRFASLVREIDSLSIREEDFRWYMEHVATMDPAIFFAMLRLAGEHTAEDVLPRVTVPTLVIAAERDTFTPSALAQHMAEAIPGAEFYLLRGASHAAPVEQPVAVEVRIDRWLAEHFATDAAAKRPSADEARASKLAG